MFVGIQKNAYSAAIEKAAKYHYFAAFRAVKTANLEKTLIMDTICVDGQADVTAL